MQVMVFQTFGERIRELRHSHNMTLTQLAAQLDMDSANLSKIETGKRDFDERRLPALCTVFNLNIDKMRIELLSDRFANKVYEDQLDSSVFLLAEEKVRYLTEKGQKQAEIDF